MPFIAHQDPQRLVQVGPGQGQGAGRPVQREPASAVRNQRLDPAQGHEEGGAHAAAQRLGAGFA